MAEHKRPTIAGEPVDVEIWNTNKFLEATAIAGEILEAAPDVRRRLSDVQEEWERANSLRMTRTAAEFRFAERVRDTVSDEAWEQDPELVLPPPSDERPEIWEQVIEVLPLAIRAAKPLVVDLLALVYTPNAVLEEADEAGRPLYGKEGATAEMARLIKHRARPAELLNLLVCAWRQLGEELRESGEAAGELGAVFGLASQGGDSDPAAQAPAQNGSGSSTDSAAPTADSPAETSSTAPPGERSPVSTPA